MTAQDGALVDRERELAALERLLGSTRRSEGGGLLVEGPPGIGKSSLLRAARAAGTEFRVVSARGGELERELPFGIVRHEAPGHGSSWIVGMRGRRSFVPTACRRITRRG